MSNNVQSERLERSLLRILVSLLYFIRETLKQAGSKPRVTSSNPFYAARFNRQTRYLFPLWWYCTVFLFLYQSIYSRGHMEPLQWDTVLVALPKSSSITLALHSSTLCLLCLRQRSCPMRHYPELIVTKKGYEGVSVKSPYFYCMLSL